MTSMTIEIPLVINDRGCWCASGSSEPGEPDWYLMEEVVTERADEPPQGLRRIMVRAVVNLPDCTPQEVSAVGVRDAEQDSDTQRASLDEMARQGQDIERG